jgi:hypothetical protein
VIQRRLVTASREIENYPKYDYILVNDRLPDSIEALKSILLAERLKHSGLQEPRSPEEAKMLATAERWRLANMRERVRQILDSFKQRPEGGR